MTNYHEIEIRRETGKRVRITVKIRTDLYRNAQVFYDVVVTYCEPRKRTWRDTWSSDDYNWRRLDPEGKKAYVQSKTLEHVTEEEINRAKMELWYKIRPI